MCFVNRERKMINKVVNNFKRRMSKMFVTSINRGPFMHLATNLEELEPANESENDKRHLHMHLLVRSHLKSNHSQENKRDEVQQKHYFEM